MNPLKSIGNFLSYHFNDVPRQFTDAAAANDFKTVEALLDRYGPQLIDKSGAHSSKETALMEAAYKGHGEMVDFLIARGADVNYSNYLGRTPLMAAAAGMQADIMEKLVGHGANKAAWDSRNETAAQILEKAHQATAKGAVGEKYARKSSSGENYMTSPAHITHPLNIFNPYR